MGSSPSKAAKSAASAATSTARKYPTRSPPTSTSTPNIRRTSAPHSAPRGTDLNPTKVGPSVHPSALPSESRNSEIELDSQDPNIGLNARLRDLGPVQPNPTYSNSSTFNSSSQFTQSNPNSSFQNFQPSASTPSQTVYPTQNSPGVGRYNPQISLLTSRYRLAEEAEKEFAQIGRKGFQGRGILDVVTLRTVLQMREKGATAEEIEKRLELRPGTVGKLGRRGVVEVGIA